MKKITELIEGSLKAIKSVIDNHKYCIENDISSKYYQNSTLMYEERYNTLKEEYDLFKEIIKSKQHIYLITDETKNIVISAWFNYNRAKEECLRLKLINFHNKFMAVQMNISN